MSALPPAMTTPERKAGWREALLVLALFALALGLRLYDLTGESLWYDETYSVWTAMMDIGSPRVLWEMKVEFPAYYWLLHVWVRLFGASDLSVRLMGAILGALTVLPVYALGRRLFDRPTGAIAALLLAVNPYHIWYSQEVRMHAAATLCVASSLVAFWRLLRGGRWPWWLAHLLLTALTFYLHSYVVFVIDLPDAVAHQDVIPRPAKVIVHRGGAAKHHVGVRGSLNIKAHVGVPGGHPRETHGVQAGAGAYADAGLRQVGRRSLGQQRTVDAQQNQQSQHDEAQVTHEPPERAKTFRSRARRHRGAPRSRHCTSRDQGVKCAQAGLRPVRCVRRAVAGAKRPGR